MREYFREVDIRDKIISIPSDNTSMEQLVFEVEKEKKMELIM